MWRLTTSMHEELTSPIYVTPRGNGALAKHQWRKHGSVEHEFFIQ